MTLISYRGEIVASTGGTRFYFSPRLEGLDTDDPLVRFVSAMIAFSFAVGDGSAPGPYTDERAERFARLMLIDDEEFRSLDAERFDDLLIAGHLGVPVEQVDEMRHDLRLLDRSAGPPGLSQPASKLELALAGTGIGPAKPETKARLRQVALRAIRLQRARPLGRPVSEWLVGVIDAVARPEPFNPPDSTVPAAAPAERVWARAQRALEVVDTVVLCSHRSRIAQ